jgi:hypothetical protein
VALALLAVAHPMRAQTGGARPLDPEVAPRPQMILLRADSRIVIDGRLNEAAWYAATPITEFVQAQPDEGRPATEATAVRLLFDDTNLYISAVCYDSDPNALIVQSLERDYPGVLSEDMDALGISLDTFFDRRNSFLFFVNPAGGLKDGQGFDNGRTRDYGWDGVVSVRTAVHDSGWTVEMAIPWKTLRFDPRSERRAWGLNLSRRVRRKNEVAYWAPLPRRDRIFLMSAAGTMDGLPQLSAGRNLTVKPFVLAARSTGELIPEGEDGNTFDAGLDLKYGLTPRLTLDLTYRTDFSQVEVDQEQVNLTRFPLFFPEQREFFLENSGTFTFGDVNGGPGSARSGTSLRDFTLFHSREIGLDDGRPVPLVGGARVTGRVGEMELGVLDVHSEAFGGNPAENFGVMRMRGSVFDNADVGVLLTNRQATGSLANGEYNRSLGVDANVRVHGNLIINAYGAATRAHDAGGEAVRVAAGWRDRLWDLSGAFRHIGAEFDPGIGFVRRRGIRDYYLTVGARPRPNIAGILEVNPYVESQFIAGLDGVLQTRVGRAGFGVTFQDGGSIATQFADRFERLDVPFTVRQGAVLPPGDYGFREASASYSSSRGRKLSGSAGVSGGGFYNGHRFTIEGSARWQPDYHVTIDLEATHNALTVQDTSFTADLYGARVKYAFSTRVYVGAFIQYNADVEQVVTNLRLNVIHAPLSDVFLVFNERRDVASGGVGVLERFATLKVTRLLAF